MKVPLCVPSLGQQEIEKVVSVLGSGWLAHGDCNHDFEKAMAELLGVPHAISMNSCASALEVSLLAAGIGGEVICPSFTFVATANAIVNAGATPVFCEVDRATRNVSAQSIAQHLTGDTEAVMVVHYGGQPCAMDDIAELCERKGLLLVEDSAETLGATWNGRQAGSFGMGCFSFFPTKNITTGEGGMLTCHDGGQAEKARALIGHGIASTTLARERKTKPWLRAAALAGRNMRMPNPLAALGLVQLGRLAELNTARVELARRYDAALAPLAPQLLTPAVAPEATHVYQMYTVEVAGSIRDQVLSRLREADIGASVHFEPPVHLQPYYLERGWSQGMLPITERLAKEIFTLPLYPGMTTGQQDYVIEILKQAMDEASA